MIDRVIHYLINKNVLDNDNKEIYEYGLFVFLFNIVNIMSVVFIGFLVGRTFYSIIFLLAFIPIRILAGGFHFKSAVLCCLFFNTCLLIILIMSKHLIYPSKTISLICIILLFISTYLEYGQRLKILIPLHLFLLIELLLIFQNNSNLYIVSYAILFNAILYFMNKLLKIDIKRTDNN